MNLNLKYRKIDIFIRKITDLWPSTPLHSWCDRTLAQRGPCKGHSWLLETSSPRISKLWASTKKLSKDTVRLAHAQLWIFELKTYTPTVKTIIFHKIEHKISNNWKFGFLINGTPKYQKFDILPESHSCFHPRIIYFAEKTRKHPKFKVLYLMSSTFCYSDQFFNKFRSIQYNTIQFILQWYWTQVNCFKILIKNSPTILEYRYCSPGP